MSTHESAGAKNEKEGLQDYFDLQEWIPFSDRYPRTGRRVFVKMVCGSVEIANWDAAVGLWNYSPLIRRGTPAYWAALPMPHEAS